MDVSALHVAGFFFRSGRHSRRRLRFALGGRGVRAAKPIMKSLQELIEMFAREPDTDDPLRLLKLGVHYSVGAVILLTVIFGMAALSALV